MSSNAANLKATHLTARNKKARLSEPFHYTFYKTYFFAADAASIWAL